MRFVERLRARKTPGHVIPPFLFRLPHVMFNDYKIRNKLATELGVASEDAHDRFIVLANNQTSVSYNTFLETYVLNYLPLAVKQCWIEDDFEIMVVSDRIMKVSYATSCRRNGKKLSRNRQASVNGLYIPMDEAIYVKEGIIPFAPTVEKYCWQSTEDICGHEIGHYVDEIFNFPSVDDRLFLEAYRTERHRVDSYSAADNREYFATTCWICRRYPRIARKYLPQTYHFFKVMFNYE